MTKNKLRIAVYIRIGGTGEYATTFELQKARFTEKISGNPDWQLKGIYADVGADSRKQPNLGRLMADCRAGLIDLVITKSIARISRNLRLAMKTVRELAYLKPPVGVYFEDIKMNTLEKDKYLLLSMIEAMAVHESETKNDCLPLATYLHHLKTKESFLKGADSDEECDDDETHED